MKKDIPQLKVTDIAVAMLPAEDDSFWDVFLLNLKDESILNVLVSSRGFGLKDGEKVSTTQLRYYYEAIEALNATKIEPVDKELFFLSHEYWVSFQYNGDMYDRKYTFVPGSLSEENFVQLPIIEKKGVLIL
jgi:hypothetical protein